MATVLNRPKAEAVGQNYGIASISSSSTEDAVVEIVPMTFGLPSQTLLVRYISTDTDSTDQATEEKYRNLATQWREDTQFESSIDRIISHGAYRQIMAMGWSAVPLMLAELQIEPDFWFWALSAITGESPEPQGSEGDLDAMANAWVEWGRRKGLLFDARIHQGYMAQYR